MRPRLRIAAALLLVFAAGAASHSALRRVLAGAPQNDRSPTWTELARTLQLSAEQQRRIDAVFANYQPKTDALLLELAPRLQALTDSMDADLLPILDPAQREQLGRMKNRTQFLLRRKTPQGERVDTLRLRPPTAR